MPYIIPDSRELIDAKLKPLLEQIQFYLIGDLNYVITTIILQWLKDYSKPSYQNYNEVIGVLECAKMEMYRRAIAPYEDKKIKENGDVY